MWSYTISLNYRKQHFCILIQLGVSYLLGAVFYMHYHTELLKRTSKSVLLLSLCKQEKKLF